MPAILKKISLYVLVVFYIAAGINHFINPQFYTGIMPPYIPAHKEMVALSGAAELILGLLLIFPKTRKQAGWLIAVMLVVFIPVHIYILQQSYTIEEYSVSTRGAWIRMALQPVLIVWVLWHARQTNSKQV